MSDRIQDIMEFMSLSINCNMVLISKEISKLLISKLLFSTDIYYKAFYERFLVILGSITGSFLTEFMLY